jgi:hypothetical protein
MREVTREEMYDAADWLARMLVPAMCREVTGLPWPSLDDLPDMGTGARRAALDAAEAIHPRIQAAFGASTAALGDRHPLSEALGLATAIINECKFKSHTADLRETAVTRVARIAGIALALDVELDGISAIARWDPLADDARPFREAVLSGPC